MAALRALPKPCLPAAARPIHVKTEESEGGEGKGEGEGVFSPDALGSSKDDPLLISSDDEDDETESDDDFPPLGEITASNTPGALLTPVRSGRPKASADNALRRASIDDGVEHDGVTPLPETQGPSADTAIVIPGKDENENEDKDEDGEVEEEEKAEEQEEEEGGGEEEEDAGQVDTVCAPPPEEIVSGILEVGPGVSRGDIPGVRTESPAPLSVPSRPSSDTSLKRRHEDEDEETDETDNADTDERDTVETSGTECDTPVQLPSPLRKAPVSPCRVGDSARDGRETTPLQRGLLHQDSDSSDDELTPAFGEEGGEDDEDDEDYSPSHTEMARPQRKRRKISTLSHHIQEHPTDDPPEGRATDTVQATYDEWPLGDVRLKRVTEGGRTVFQIQFAWDSHHQHHPKAGGGQGALARKPGVSGTKFTEDEDSLLIELKEVDDLTWREIHTRFSKQFQGRSRGALQVRYSNKLKGREQRAGRRPGIPRHR